MVTPQHINRKSIYKKITPGRSTIPVDGLKCGLDIISTFPNA
jgi:hypothetical protein